jgi:hypothetical protein
VVIYASIFHYEVKGLLEILENLGRMRSIMLLKQHFLLDNACFSCRRRQEDWCHVLGADFGYVL